MVLFDAFGGKPQGIHHLGRDLGRRFVDLSGRDAHRHV